MNTGVIEQIGKPNEIYTRPQTVFAARFVGDINLFRGEVAGKEGGQYLVKTELGELKAHADAGEDYSGRRLALGIRPEAIVVGEEALKCENHVQAKGIEMTGGVTIKAAFSPEVALKVMHEGAVLGWHASDSMLIEKPSVIEGLNIEEVIYGK
jgi:ABC-type Fe3+/spermidine/putrescine transport system ATPase subunit